MEFTERSPIEAGFQPIFDAEVRPKLDALEQERTRRLRKAFIGVGAALAVTVVALGLVFLIGGSDSIIGFVFMAICGGVGAFAAWGMQASGWASSVEQAVMPAICRHVGDLTYSSNGGLFPIERMRSMDLLPGYDSSTVKDMLSGTHRDTEYEMVHAVLKRRRRDSKGNTSSSTVFAGLLFHISVPMDVPGRIVLMRERGGLGNKLAEAFSFGGTRSMPKVTFDHAEFEAAFEVYADHPDRARAFMPTPFLNAILDIGTDHGGSRGATAFVAGFEERSFYMALRRSGSFMKMGSLTKSVTDMEDDLHAIFDDIALAHQIIDRLHGV